MNEGTTRRKPILLIVVVAVFAAGVLGWLWWGSGGTGPTVQTSANGPYTVEFSTDAPRIGGNASEFTITGPPVDRMTVEPVMPQMGHALPPATAAADRPGHFRAADVRLPMAGQWELTVSLHGAGGTGQVVFPVLVTQ